MIKVNQVGYFSNGAKTARVSYFDKFGSLDGKTYEIVARCAEPTSLFRRQAAKRSKHASLR